MSRAMGKPKIHVVDGESQVWWTIDKKRLQKSFDPAPEMIRVANKAGFTATHCASFKGDHCVKFILTMVPRPLSEAETTVAIVNAMAKAASDG